jgi:hypothetical protein
VSRCGNCSTTLRESDDGCPACELYNAAVAAQGAAARQLASDRFPRSERAWLNEFGVFAFLNGHSIEVASAAEAKPFAALTSEALRLRRFPRVVGAVEQQLRACAGHWPTHLPLAHLDGRTGEESLRVLNGAAKSLGLQPAEWPIGAHMPDIWSEAIEAAEALGL